MNDPAPADAAPSTDAAARDRLRRKIDDWLAERIDLNGTISVPDLIDEGVARFLNGDRQLVLDALADVLRSMLAERAHAHLHRARNRVVVGDDAIDLGDRQGSIDALRKQSASAVAEWFEYNGDHHVRVMEATRQDLTDAIDRRVRSMEGDLIVTATLARLRDPLRDGERVRDHWTDDEVAALLDRHRRRIRGGMSARRFVAAAFDEGGD